MFMGNQYARKILKINNIFDTIVKICYYSIKLRS